MAALGASCLVGPVPFKDVVDDNDHHISPSEEYADISTMPSATLLGVPPPKEYADIISTMPSVTMLGLPMQNCRGAWVPSERVTGVLAVERHFTPRPGDVLLASPPKCGTTWLKALSFATMARAVYPPSGGAVVEHPLLRLNPHQCVPLVDILFSVGQEAKLEALPSPRLMQTHMHHHLLPASVTENPDCKIVYVCREPKDMLVSLWHFVKIIMPADSTFTFSDLFECACEGKTPNGPVWDNILGYWSASKASPERVLFLRYEEMLRDPAGTVRELARFLGVPFSAADEAAGLPADIVKLCSIETMKGAHANRKGAAGQYYKFPYGSFFRKGVTGDWVNHMTPEMAQRFDAIIEDKFRGSGLTFKS